MELTKEKVLDALKHIKDPELGKGIVELGMIQNVELAGPAVRVTVALTMAGCPYKDQIKEEVRSALLDLPGIEEAKVVITTMTSEQRAKVFGRAPSEMEGMKQVKNVVAVASGKGGVGKSTVSVNLAMTLAAKGYKTGILDADMHGPDIPLMMGTKERPVGSGGMLIPLEKYGVKLMSTATLAGRGTPVIWRGPLVNKAIKEFLGHVAWGELDYLVVDLPPGTGDAPLTVSSTIPISGVIVVTTPQRVALEDVRRSIALFKTHDVPVSGIVENMSYLKIPGSDEVMEVFGSGGGEKIAKAFKLPLLGKIPLDPAIREGGDKGKPVTLDRESEASKIFDEIAENFLKTLQSK